jgi:hypothetical protein
VSADPLSQIRPDQILAVFDEWSEIDLPHRRPAHRFGSVLPTDTSGRAATAGTQSSPAVPEHFGRGGGRYHGTHHGFSESCAQPWPSQIEFKDDAEDGLVRSGKIPVHGDERPGTALRLDFPDMQGADERHPWSDRAEELNLRQPATPDHGPSSINRFDREPLKDCEGVDTACNDSPEVSLNSHHRINVKLLRIPPRGKLDDFRLSDKVGAQFIRCSRDNGIS